MRKLLVGCFMIIFIFAFGHAKTLDFKEYGLKLDGLSEEKQISPHYQILLVQNLKAQ